MRLPDNAIGITDILAYRDCPRRFAFGMQRHTEAGEHPESTTGATAYGSAIHEAIAWAESHDADDREATQRAFDTYGRWLDPADLQRLHDDLRTYRARDYTGVRTVAVEREVRVPMFNYNGETIYFRSRIDRLYQRRDNPGVFVHVDYKSSRWPKSEPEVHADPQMWATNWLVHEYWPECETLIQVYDQLLHGAVPTSKSPAQRLEIREWITHQATAILNDEELEPTRNRWCRWCPIMESCPVVERLTSWARAEIDALAPPEKDGAGEFAAYAQRLADVADARKILERFEKSVSTTLKDMPDVRRAELGYEVNQRSRTSWPPDALESVHELVGDDFYRLVGLTKTAAERHELGESILAMAERGKGAAVVQKIRDP